MEKLYRERILAGQSGSEGFVPVSALGGIKPAAPIKNAAAEKKEEVGSFGD